MHLNQVKVLHSRLSSRGSRLTTGGIGHLDKLDERCTERPYGCAVSRSRWVLWLESAWDGARLRLAGTRTPVDLRIEAYLGHGGGEGVVVRGRVLDDPTPSEAVEGEGVRDAVLRTVRHFLTDDLPGVPLRVTVGDACVETVTDDDGYFLAAPAPRPRPAHDAVDDRDGRAGR